MHERLMKLKNLADPNLLNSCVYMWMLCLFDLQWNWPKGKTSQDRKGQEEVHQSSQKY